MLNEHLKITGMSCGSCSSKVTKALRALPGVTNVAVSLAAGEAQVDYDERLASSAQLKAAVKAAGYGVGAHEAAINPMPADVATATDPR